MNSGHSTKSDDRDSGSFYYFAKLLTCEFDHGHAKKKGIVREKAILPRPAEAASVFTAVFWRYYGAIICGMRITAESETNYGRQLP